MQDVIRCQRRRSECLSRSPLFPLLEDAPRPDHVQAPLEGDPAFESVDLA
jgi:hypothetical protein